MNQTIKRANPIKTKLSILSVLLLLSVASVSGFAQDIWEPSNGPYGGSVNAIISTPNGSVYAGVRYGGIFKSTDKGLSWQSTSMGSAIFSLFAVSDSIMFAGSYSSYSLYRTTDAWGTWELKNNGLPNSTVESMVISSDGYIFAATGEGVYRSSDNGDKWIAVNNNLTDLNVDVLAITSENVIYAGTYTGGLFRSTNDGDSWAPVPGGLPVTSVAGLAIDKNNDIYVALGSGNGVYTSTSDGDSWTAIGMTGKNLTALAINSSGDLFVGGWQSGIYYSTNNGTTWEASGLGYAPLNVETIHVEPINQDVFVGCMWYYGGGIYYANSDWSQFEVRNEGLTGTRIWRMAISPSTGTIFAGDYDVGLYRSHDMGLTWEVIGNGMPELQSSLVRALAAHPSGTIFSGSSGGGLHRSMSDGEDWMRIDQIGEPYVTVGAVAVREDGYVFMGAKWYIDADPFIRIFMSDNEGDSWTDITNGMEEKVVTCFAFNHDQEIYIGTSSDGVFKSSDNGQVWSTVGSDISTYGISDMAINSKGHVYVHVDGQGIFKTEDNSTWTQLGSALLGTTKRPIAINSKDHIFVGFYMSKDDGNTWLRYDTGLNSSEINDLVFNMEEHLFAGTYHGVFRTFEPTIATKIHFAVKMKHHDGFDSAKDQVVVRGWFNNWGESDLVLSAQEDADWTYEGTAMIINSDEAIRDGRFEFKYAIPKGEATTTTDDEWENFPYNRSVEWDGNSDLQIEDVWFSNERDFTRMQTNTVMADTNDSYGVAWGDFNGDGVDDLVVTRGGSSSDQNELFEGKVDGNFVKINAGPVITDNGDSRAACWGDYDNDGHLDLFVTNLLGESNKLYRNKGDGTFEKMDLGAITSDDNHSIGAVWADFNNDSYLDMFVCNAVGENNFLYFNNQGTGFTKETAGTLVGDGGDSRGCAAADFNNDGYMDLYVANSGEEPGEFDFLYMNNGDSTFTKITTDPIVNEKGKSLGGSWGDYNNDGWLDLYVSYWLGKPNILFKNLNGTGFIAVAESEFPADSSDSRGSAWVDFDNDGWLDLYVNNYDYGSGQGVNFLYRNSGGFSRIETGPMIEGWERNARGAAWSDYNNDGAPDLFVATENGLNGLYRNNLSGNNWFKVKLTGTISNAAAIGATVVLKTQLKDDTGNEVILRRTVEGQSGLIGQNSQTLMFGLGDVTTVDSVIIYWPSGIVNKYDTKPVNQVMSFTEFEPTVVPPKVILDAPQDQSADISLPPGLAWNTAHGASKYHLQVSTEIGFSTNLVDENTITDTIFTITNALSITTYYWRVQAGNESGWGEWSGTWKFTTGSSTVIIPPLAPGLKSPADGETSVTIPPTLSWNAVGGAQKYWFQVAESSDFNTGMMAQDSNTSSTSYTTGGGSYNTLYYWRVKAKNEASWGPWSNVWSFTTEPLTGLPDSPTLVGPVDGKTGVPIPVPLVWNSAAAGSYVVEIATDLSFSNIVFSRSDNPERYLFANGLNHNQQYHWRVRIIVSGTNSDWSNVWSFTTYTDKIEINNVTVPFPSHERKDEFSVSDYRMMGLPGNADIAFSDVLGDGAKENWMAYWDNGKSGTPDVYLFSYDGSGIFRFVTGKGFWIIHNGSININQSIPNAPLNELAQAEISIHQGWNIITCPFGHSISWSAVKFVNNITAASPIFRYNSLTHSFDSSDKLDPVQGFYLYNNNPARTTLLVPFIDGSGKVSAQSDLSWEVTLELSSGETIDASAKIGVAIDAEIGLDRHEYRKPRGIANLANIYFDRSEWDANYGIFANDIRPEIDGMETWDFKVYASVNEASKFSLIGLETIPEAYEVYLVDRTHQRYQNLRKNDVYEFNSTPQISDFELVVGEADVVEEKIQSILPAEYTLGQNYPNPFNPTTTIPLTLPEQSDITLKVYNLLGQEIVTLFKGNLNAGKHYIIWNGANQVNQRMPSGVYMYQMLTEKGRRFTGKMVLIK